MQHGDVHDGIWLCILKWYDAMYMRLYVCAAYVMLLLYVHQTAATALTHSRV